MHVKCYWFSISVVLCYNVSERIYRKGEQSGVKQKLLLIDGNSILNRAFYGLPDMTNSQGLHTNAILGFLNIMFKFLIIVSSYLLVKFLISSILVQILRGRESDTSGSCI